MGTLRSTEALSIQCARGYISSGMGCPNPKIRLVAVTLLDGFDTVWTTPKLCNRNTTGIEMIGGNVRHHSVIIILNPAESPELFPSADRYIRQI